MTTLTEDQVYAIETLLFDDDQMRSYSGRGMYGRECLGVAFDSMKEAFNFALAIDDMHIVLANPKFDDLGRGVIVYWPNIEAPENIRELEEI